MSQKTTARILLYDIEIASDIGDSWQKWNTNIHHYRRDWYMLCFAYKWLGEKKTHVVAQPDFKSYKKGSTDDRELVNALWDLFDEADIVIAHNGDSFDQKKSNTRMVINGRTPASPYFEIDTKKVAKRYFGFTSNKLDDLARQLGIKGKLDTGGYSLWLGCEEGDPKAWKKMKSYNKQDVWVLEQVYLRLRPWIKNHPPINTIINNPTGCPTCGKGPLTKQGVRATKTNTYQRYRCSNCRSWHHERIADYRQLEERMKYV